MTSTSVIIGGERYRVSAVSAHAMLMIDSAAAQLGSKLSGDGEQSDTAFREAYLACLAANTLEAEDGASPFATGEEALNSLTHEQLMTVEEAYRLNAEVSQGSIISRSFQETEEENSEYAGGSAGAAPWGERLSDFAGNSSGLSSVPGTEKRTARLSAGEITCEQEFSDTVERRMLRNGSPEVRQ